MAYRLPFWLALAMFLKQILFAVAIMLLHTVYRHPNYSVWKSMLHVLGFPDTCEAFKLLTFEAHRVIARFLHHSELLIVVTGLIWQC